MPTRRIVLLSSAAVLSGSRPAFPKIDKGPPLASGLVKEFVVTAHGKLERTETMLAANPGLLNATWDWGGGDFETGLGGASHMGAREIALFLIGKGTRMDLFAAAMLGRLDIVRAGVAAFPAAAKSLGPHGIPLIQHARKGGSEAQEIVKYLESLEA